MTDPDDIVFVEPPSGNLWSKGLNVREDENWQPAAIELLGPAARAHRDDSVARLDGCSASRRLCPKFPPLVVTGGSGYGKTTILETVLRTFGFWTQPARSPWICNAI